jgi:hypothetical protein
MSKHRTANAEADQLGLQLAQALHEAPLPEGMEDRLRAAREAALQAAAMARESRLALEPSLASAGAHASSGKSQGRWTLVVLSVVLVAGLLAIGQSQWMQHVLGHADADAALLKDALPPNVYGDPGFNEFLDEKPEGETPAEDEAETVDR